MCRTQATLLVGYLNPGDPRFVAHTYYATSGAMSTSVKHFKVIYFCMCAQQLQKYLPYFLGLPRSLEGVQKFCQPRRLVLRQIERLVRTLKFEQSEGSARSKIFQKLPKKNEQAHKQDGEERGVT